MKILFAADMSFNYFDGFPGKENAYLAMQEAAERFRQADFSMINLENVLGDRENGTPIIKSGPNLICEDAFFEYVNALKPDIVGMANNHTKDYGEGIMFHTMQMLADNDYTYIGAGHNIEEAYKAAKISKDGVDAAIIAVCENEFGIATEEISGTAGYQLGRVTKAVQKALMEGCKPIIYFHGGNETNPFPSPGKVELYRHFIDLGAEAVIAMHTHCPQGYEFYNGKPIVYSMGNFFFPHKKDKEKSWYHGYMSELDISRDGISMEIYPYKFDFDKITLLQGEEKAYFLKYMECLCKPIKDHKELQKWFDAWCASSGYVTRLAEFLPEQFADGHTEEVKAIKNILNCEAHNEVIKNALMLTFESRLEEAKPRMELIKKLRNLECI